MITDALLDLVYNFVLLVARLISNFGDVGANNAVTTSIVTFKTYYNSLNAYLPIDTIVQQFAVIMAFEVAYQGYKLLKWGYQKIPGIS